MDKETKAHFTTVHETLSDLFLNNHLSLTAYVTITNILGLELNKNG